MIQGRITKGVGGRYSVSTANGVYTCSVRGIFRRRRIIPTVGDFVDVEASQNQPQVGTIVDIHARKNSLERPRVANLDLALLVFSIANPALNVDLLDHFLVTADYKGVEPVICFNKMDLIDLIDAEAFYRLCDVYEKGGYAVVCLSTSTGEGMTRLKDMLAHKVSVFAGPSGAGKSSLFNAIVETEHMATGALSLKIQRGKHTTRHTELVEAFEGTFIADSPGFTTLETEGLNTSNLPQLFREFRPFLNQCRFNDCKHLNEPDCMIKAHVGEAINTTRYERYKSMMLEVMEGRR